MIRSLLRLAGLLLLAAGFIVAVLDGVRWIATGSFVPAHVGVLVAALFPEAYPAIGPAVARHIHPFLWDHVLEPAFAAPAGAALAGLGVLLLWLGRRPPPTIGFAPR
jgi:hypothetical protein